MSKRIIISLNLLFYISLSTLSCVAQENKKEKPQLIFKSGFEGNTRVVADEKSNDYGAKLEYITGSDNTSSKKGNWDLDWATELREGKMQVQFTGGDSSKRYVKVVDEPGNPKNKVLKFWLNDSWLASENQQKARVQTNVYGIKSGLKEFFQSVRVFLTEDFNALKSYPKKITWCTISEFWNNEWWVEGEKHGFRVTLGIGKAMEGNGELHFILEGEDAGQKKVWEADHNSSNVAVPIGKWFTMDYYFKEGDANTGRFYLAITPDGENKKVVYDVHNFTHMTTDKSPDGVTGYNPMKLYTAKEIVNHVKSEGKTLQIYWDDFMLWKNKKP